MVAGECPDFPEKTKEDLPYTLHGELLEKYGEDLRHAQQVTLRGWTIGALFQIEWLRIVLGMWRHRQAFTLCLIIS